MKLYFRNREKSLRIVEHYIKRLAEEISRERLYIPDSEYKEVLCWEKEEMGSENTKISINTLVYPFTARPISLSKLHF